MWYLQYSEIAFYANLFYVVVKVNGQCQPGHTRVWHENQHQEDKSNVHLTSGQDQG